VKKREALTLAMNLGWTMFFSLALPLLGGIWLDRKLDTSPLFTLVGMLLGILAATLGVARVAIRDFRSVMAEMDEQARDDDEEEPA
jgi:F0F1-type ATP synthase assembly protein I